MQIYANQWHARVYRFARIRWLQFLGKDPEFKMHQLLHTNVCIYVRTVVLCMLTLLAAHVAAAGTLFYTGVYFPFTYFGPARVFTVLLIVVAIIGGIVGVIWLIAIYVDWRKKRKRARNAPPKGPSTINIAAQYLRDAHDMVCSPVEIVAPPRPATELIGPPQPPQAVHTSLSLVKSDQESVPAVVAPRAGEIVDAVDDPERIALREITHQPRWSKPFPWWACVLTVFVSLILAVMEHGIFESFDPWVPVASKECSLRSFKKVDGETRVEAIVQCDAKMVTLADPDTVVALAEATRQGETRITCDYEVTQVMARTHWLCKPVTIR